MRSRSLRPPLPTAASWWLEEARLHRPDSPAPPLRTSLVVDVAVAGGGYTGLWTALALKRRDPALRVALLEAREIGLGPSGRNGGFLHGYWSSLPTLRAVFGAERALRVAKAGDGAIPAVRALDEDVWLREAGMLKVAATAAEDEAVARAAAVARELGAADEAVALSREEVRGRIASPRFRAGVLYRDGATVQPARLALALKRAALAAGVEIFEGTPVTRIGDGALETAAARVRAREVVLGLNAWSTSWPLGGRQTNFASAVVLTEPVPELLAEIGWTGGEAVVDARMFLHYFRTTPDGRVLMGSGSGSLGFGGRVGMGLLDDVAAQARAHAGLRALLPALAEAPIAARWSGPIDVSVDRLPRFGTVPGTRIHFGAGYSGNGVGPSWLGGRILASLALGEEDEWSSLPLVGPRPKRLPPEPLRYVGGRAIRWGTLASEEAAAAGRRAPAPARAAAAIPRLLRLPLGTR